MLSEAFCSLVSADPRIYQFCSRRKMGSTSLPLPRGDGGSANGSRPSAAPKVKLVLLVATSPMYNSQSEFTPRDCRNRIAQYRTEQNSRSDLSCALDNHWGCSGLPIAFPVPGFVLKRRLSTVTSRLFLERTKHVGDHMWARSS